MQNPSFRVFFRLFTLAILLVSILVISRDSDSTRLASAMQESIPLSSQQSPIVTVEVQQGVPLLISSPRVLLTDSEHVEFAFDLTNASSKAVRAYTIRQEDGTPSNKFSFHNLDLSGKPLLDMHFLATDFATSDLVAGKDEHIVLSVDYVEFADGTKWGVDLSNSAETSAGQRAAGAVMSAALGNILKSGNARDVMKAIDAGRVNFKPPATRSEQWKQGFEFGITSMTRRLKRADRQGGPNQVERELRQLSTKLDGAP